MAMIRLMWMELNDIESGYHSHTEESGTDRHLDARKALRILPRWALAAVPTHQFF